MYLVIKAATNQAKVGIVLNFNSGLIDCSCLSDSIYIGLRVIFSSFWSCGAESHQLVVNKCTTALVYRLIRFERIARSHHRPLADADRQIAHAYDWSSFEVQRLAQDRPTNAFSAFSPSADIDCDCQAVGLDLSAITHLPGCLRQYRWSPPRWDWDIELSEQAAFVHV